jgi:NitT/TauT family transport system substrate-binding protein
LKGTPFFGRLTIIFRHYFVLGTSPTAAKGDWMVLHRPVAILTVLFFLLTCKLGVCAERTSEITKIKLGMGAMQGGLAGVWTAKEKGFFEQENIDVEIINFTGGTEGVFALASGDIPICVVSGPAACRAMVAGVDIKFVAELLDSLPFVLMVAPNINTPSDLIGKRVGILGFGGATDFVIRRILAQLNLDISKVCILPMGGESTRLAALQAGSTDATVLLPPCSTIARKCGFKELPGGNAENIRGQQDFLVASGRALAEQRDCILGVLRAIIKGSRYFKGHPDDGRTYLAMYFGIEDPEVLNETYESFRRLLTTDGTLHVEGIRNLLDFVADDPRARELEAEKLIDMSLVEELVKNGNIIPSDE